MLRSPRKRLPLLGICALLAIVAVGAAGAKAATTSSAAKAPNPNTEAGLTDAQRNAIYQNNSLQWEQKLQTWYANLDTSKLGDLHNLRRGEMMADFVQTPAPSLQLAVAKADVVATVTVTSIRSMLLSTDPSVPPLTVTYVTARVESHDKGSLPNTVMFRQNGGLVPTPDWSGVEISDAATEPILLPGDRVILLLNSDSVTASSKAYIAGQYLIEPWTGEYKLDANDKVVPLDQNPFKVQVAGESETTLRAAIQAAVVSN
jgi:hypothetical protein